ncbi:23S rRNA (adenine(1618)-N(6))-methyltransferase RlmF [Dyadobacter psychrotolerans]|uniref:Ribosomal RNA large subunit methyltransferase F n=1 Tax=Dyadobacter psychrotolerans TaxID=2541721 RepID=A0A4V2Z403_9BACT|nr:23S rRNA (adenine(1618)-N(6))-methyltransferase RlmF [Dyadobacter psychrotolerans]TDE14678.1 23S rRNA (adenine(1618)-N(6))-methyltransferase RlmF [Dyadobacter psychrotolerans]
MKSKPQTEEKQNLHPRNLHRSRYDFKALIKSSPALSRFVAVNQYGNESIDFANPVAVKELNKAILRHFYNIKFWDIPAGYLCPPIPGRADYLHYIADLLKADSKIPGGGNIRGMDVGMGANCVYPIIGHQVYGWSFVGSDVDVTALHSARQIADKNPDLKAFIECRLQKYPANIFAGIILHEDRFDFTMCNPPFHASQAEANAGTKRKWQNLGKDKIKQNGTLNFAGQPAELWYPGGEQAFIIKMIEESAQIEDQVLWFTSLVSKKTTLPSLYQALKKVKAMEVKTIEMSQGQKVSRMLAWTFIGKDVWQQEK